MYNILTHFGCESIGCFSQISWIDMTGEDENHLSLRSLVAFSKSCIVCAAGDFNFDSFLRASTFSSYSSTSWLLDGSTELVEPPQALGRTIS